MKIAKSQLKQIIEEEFAAVFSEAVDPTYNQRYYNLVATCTIDRTLGGEREETLREIRGIPGVTTVSAAEGSVSQYENKWRMDLNIKFALVGTASLKKYQTHVLSPGLKNIKGLNVLNTGMAVEI